MLVLPATASPVQELYLCCGQDASAGVLDNGFMVEKGMLAGLGDAGRVTISPAHALACLWVGAK